MPPPLPPIVSTLALPAEGPRLADIWRIRVRDLVALLGHLDVVSRSMPGLAGRMDPTRIAVAGHSWGGQTAGMLPGARDLLLLRGGEHGLGGIVGPGAAETTDEDPARVAVVAQSTAAWLRTALGVDADAWRTASATVPAAVAAVVSR